jgi:hypothetical protein
MAATAAILDHLQRKGIAARTGQRALPEAKKAGRIDQPERGQWRLTADQASEVAA